MAQRPDWMPPLPRRRMPDGLKALLIVAAILVLIIVIIIAITAS